MKRAVLSELLRPFGWRKLRRGYFFWALVVSWLVTFLYVVVRINQHGGPSTTLHDPKTFQLAGFNGIAQRAIDPEGDLIPLVEPWNRWAVWSLKHDRAIAYGDMNPSSANDRFGFPGCRLRGDYHNESKFRFLFSGARREIILTFDSDPLDTQIERGIGLTTAAWMARPRLFVLFLDADTGARKREIWLDGWISVSDVSSDGGRILGIRKPRFPLWGEVYEAAEYDLNTGREKTFNAEGWDAWYSGGGIATKHGNLSIATHFPFEPTDKWVGPNYWFARPAESGIIRFTRVSNWDCDEDTRYIREVWDLKLNQWTEEALYQAPKDFYYDPVSFSKPNGLWTMMQSQTRGAVVRFEPLGVRLLRMDSTSGRISVPMFVNDRTVALNEYGIFRFAPLREIEERLAREGEFLPLPVGASGQ